MGVRSKGESSVPPWSLWDGLAFRDVARQEAGTDDCLEWPPRTNSAVPEPLIRSGTGVRPEPE